MKVLIIQQKMIGDVLTSSILCEAIRASYPQSKIHYLINAHTIAVLDHNPYIDKQIIFTPEMEESASLRKGLKTALKNENYKIVIDVYSKIGSAEITKATRAPTRIGYNKWYTKWAYTHTFNYNKIPTTTAGLAIENRMLLLEPLEKDFPAYYTPKIYLTKEEKASAAAILQKNSINLKKPIVMIALLGSSIKKTYPLTYMAQVLDHIVSTKKYQLLLNYIPNQQEQVNKLLSLVSQETKTFIYDQVYGKSLREFLALCSHCHAIVGNEGGAINMAKALGIASFSIFSPWITREAWGLFENEKNISFHLKDISPEVYDDKKIKTIRKEYALFYQKMNPDAIIPKLEHFLNTVLT